jgi:hypothetical protein
LHCPKPECRAGNGCIGRTGYGWCCIVIYVIVALQVDVLPQSSVLSRSWYSLPDRCRLHWC